MAGFEFNIIRYLTLLSSSLAIVAFLIYVHCTIFSLDLIENIETFLPASFVILVIIYTAIKRSAKMYFRKADKPLSKSPASKHSINIRNNITSILSDEALYFSIGKVNMICVLVLVNSFFLPIYNLYWLFAVGGMLGAIISCAFA